MNIKTTQPPQTINDKTPSVATPPPVIPTVRDALLAVSALGAAIDGANLPDNEHWPLLKDLMNRARGIASHINQSGTLNAVVTTEFGSHMKELRKVVNGQA